LSELAAPVTLSNKEARSLVSRINNQSADVRALILALHDGQGWKALGYESWKACVEGEFVFSRQYAYALLEAAVVERRLSTMVDSGHLPERHVRELRVAPAERQAEVYREAKESAPASGLTAEHIRQTVVRMKLAPNRWGARATESNMKDYLVALDRATPMQLEVILRKCLPSIPARVLFKAVDEARYMTGDEQSEFNRRPWSAS
jgi:hypothetical protein